MRLGVFLENSRLRRRCLLVLVILTTVCLLLLPLWLFSEYRAKQRRPQGYNFTVAPVLSDAQKGILIPEEGAAFLRLMLKPPTGFAEPPSPFAKERNPAYTEEQVLELLPAIDPELIETLRQQRKERLHVIFSAVD